MVSAEDENSFRQELETVTRVFRRHYSELRRIAARELRSLGQGQTLAATELVHMFFVKLKARGNDERCALPAAARAMRGIIIDHIRAKRAHKRGGRLSRISLGDQLPIEIPGKLSEDELLELDAAIDRLEEERPRCAQVIQLHFFCDLSNDEIAGILGISVRTAERDWKIGKAYLRRLIEGS